MKRFLLLTMIALLIVPSYGTVRAGDIWLINTRSVGSRHGVEGLERLSVEKCEEILPATAYRWKDSSWNDFRESHQPEKPLVIVVHGNWMPLRSARHLSFPAANRARSLGEHRFLIWSWPSERTDRGLRQDAQLKARRADSEAQILADFLRHLDPKSRVSLVGFSFGARLVCQTLQILATDEFLLEADRVLPRTILLAAAMDCGALQEGRSCGKALSATEEMLVHVNAHDKTLRFYPRMVSRHGPRAVGREGVIQRGIAPELRSRIKSVRVDRVTGPEHGYVNSLRALLSFENDFRHYALFQ